MENIRISCQKVNYDTVSLCLRSVLERASKAGKETCFQEEWNEENIYFQHLSVMGNLYEIARGLGVSVYFSIYKIQ